MKIIRPRGMEPAGHYVPATLSHGVLRVSGQLPIDPATGRLVEGDIRQQLRQALRNLDAILKEAGCTRENVLECRVYVPDIRYWAEANEEYAAYFGAHRPARVIVPCGALHYGALSEIEAVAEVEE